MQEEMDKAFSDAFADKLEEKSTEAPAAEEPKAEEPAPATQEQKVEEKPVKTRSKERAANDPRDLPKPVNAVVESVEFKPAELGPLVIPQPTREEPPRAANDPRVTANAES